MKQTIARLLSTGAAFACVAAGLATPMRADTAAASSSSDATTAASDVTTLEKFTVSDVPVDQQVLPTTHPVGSVFGDDRSILDTPRSVSVVNKAWMDDRNVKDAMDFGQFSPGVYSAAQYGIPGVPQIRGDLGQIYMNGQILPFSRNSTPLSFNGVESMDIVKGPGSAVYGPQGQGPGGYVNFVPKQPYFDREHVDVSATWGGWTSGHSYSNPEYTIDFGGPLSDKLAYRVSYLGRYGDGFYLASKNETQDVYSALTYRLSSKTTLEWWAQGFATRTNEISGTNRVTQDFIWNGHYIAGPSVPVTSGPNAYFGYDIFLTPTPAAGTFPSTADGSYSVVNPATAHTVTLPAQNALVGAQDTARSKLFQSQLKASVELSPETTVVNLAYIGSNHSNKFETYGYDEYVPKDISLQDRFEVHTSFDLAKVSNNIITGLDYRYTHLRAYSDYQTEPFTSYDLTQPVSSYFYPGYYYEQKTWGGGLQIPGAPGYSAAGGIAGSSGADDDYEISDFAAFVQDDVKLSSQWSAILGFREDALTGTHKNAPVVQVGAYDAYYDYIPLATPKYWGLGSYFSAKGSKVDPSYFTSIVFKIDDTQSLYFTYDRVDAIQGGANFGGVNGTNTDAIKRSLSTGSTLYETGYKGSFFHNVLYGSIALFQQQKLEPQLIGNPYIVKDNGLEVDTVFQPTKQFTINANLTYQVATAYGGYYFQETGSYLDAFATSTVVDGLHGTGKGAPNYTGYEPATGRMRAPGVPALIVNVFAEYKMKNGLSFGAGPNFIGKQYANDQDTLHIPAEYEVDGHITYAPTKKWDVRLNISNLLNARLLDPIDVSFAGNDVIFVRKPISASITVRYHL